jgi:hypothetical protein
MNKQAAQKMPIENSSANLLSSHRAPSGWIQLMDQEGQTAKPPSSSLDARRGVFIFNIPLAIGVG